MRDLGKRPAAPGLLRFARNDVVGERTVGGKAFALRVSQAACPKKNQFGEIATPQGSRPTGMLFTTFSASTSITETSFEVPLVVKSCF
jgi:hypothetical protein